MDDLVFGKDYVLRNDNLEGIHCFRTELSGQKNYENEKTQPAANLTGGELDE